MWTAVAEVVGDMDDIRLGIFDAGGRNDLTHVVWGYGMNGYIITSI